MKPWGVVARSLFLSSSARYLPFTLECRLEQTLASGTWPYFGKAT